MAWIASQKPRGKFYGLVTGSFLAFAWGNWHDRIINYFNYSFSKRISQFGLITVFFK
jgi:hypothetical protein